MENAKEKALEKTGAAVPLLLLFLAIVADGFDTAALGFIIPTLSSEWGVRPSDLTVPLLLTNLGVVIGYVASGRLSARFGRHKVVWLSVAFYSVSVVLTPLAGAVPGLSAFRFVTGLGLGAVLPAAVSLAVDLVSPRRRDAAALFVAMGLAVGITLSGLVGGAIIRLFGWEAAFWVPGVAAMVLVPFMVWKLPNVAPTGAPGLAVTKNAGVLSLFAKGLRARTSMLWAFAFFAFITLYILQSWLPTFLLEYGFSPEQVPLGTAALGFGGLIGGLSLALLSARFSAPKLITIGQGIAFVTVLILALVPLGFVGLLVLIGLSGAAQSTGTGGQSALAIRMYTPAARTTGVGLSAALGRLGSIVGPAIGGLLLASGVPASTILLSAAIPILVAGVIVATMTRLFFANPGRDVTEGRREAAVATVGE
ncbi:MFS transporter [Paenarthrobacter sp. NPDC091669]|uniref:MFS transporter n=1 Tax=Paenarthrobacter sp. NPDC091669 TaxID=3364384 RepID=UPI0038031033